MRRNLPRKLCPKKIITTTLVSFSLRNVPLTVIQPYYIGRAFFFDTDAVACSDVRLLKIRDYQTSFYNRSGGRLGF